MSRSDRGRIRIGVSGSNPLTLLACFRPTCISGYILVTSAVAFVESPTRKTDILKNISLTIFKILCPFVYLCCV